MATWSAGLDALLHDRSLVHLGLFLVALIDATGLPFPGRALLVAHVERGRGVVADLDGDETHGPDAGPELLDLGAQPLLHAGGDRLPFDALRRHVASSRRPSSRGSG